LGAGKILPKMSASKKQFSEILRSQRRRRRKNKKSKDAGAEVLQTNPILPQII
jgi:hypothetical protein